MKEGTRVVGHVIGCWVILYCNGKTGDRKDAVVLDSRMLGRVLLNWSYYRNRM